MHCWVVLGLLILSAYLSLINGESLNEPLFYIYEWPPELADVYPPANTVLHPESSYDHAFNENRGAGRMLVPDVGLFQTWQFSLFKNVMSRLVVSKYRTRFEKILNV
jgi:hypothetical protein